MKYIILSIVCTFLLQCGPKPDPSPTYEAHVFNSSSGHELPYRVLYPENYNKKKTYPLIVFLHGSGERGSDNEKQLKHIADKFQTAEFRKKYPSIILFPQCAEEDSWAVVKKHEGKWLVEDTEKTTPSMEALLEMILDFKRTNGVDKSRMYITGLSMGGFGTFDLLVRRPEWFAAAVPICGGGNKRYSYKYKDVPIWMFHGAKDPVVPVSLSQELADDFRGRQMNYRYTEYPEGEHDVWHKAWVEPDLLPWLFAQSRITQE